MEKVAIVTGASSGIGKETVRAFLRAGYVVHAAARRMEAMKELETEGAHIHYLDLKNSDAITAFVKSVLAQNSHVDILVNNAGYGSYGSVEEVSIEDARNQMEVNLFAPAELIKAVLPSMRRRRSGKIVNVSSIGGKIWSPMGAWYHASKFGLEGFSDVLRNEVRPFGIDVILIEPAGVKTEWAQVATDHLIKTSGEGPYRSLAERFVAMTVDDRTQRTSAEPKEIAEVILKAVQSPRPKARYVAPFAGKMFLFARKVLNDRAFDRISDRFFKLPKRL